MEIPFVGLVYMLTPLPWWGGQDLNLHGYFCSLLGFAFSSSATTAPVGSYDFGLLASTNSATAPCIAGTWSAIPDIHYYSSSLIYHHTHLSSAAPSSALPTSNPCFIVRGLVGSYPIYLNPLISQSHNPVRIRASCRPPAGYPYV